MKKLLFLFGLVFVFIATTSFAEDSPLVQAAKKEKERRAKIDAKKSFTNQDIEQERSKTQLGMESASTGSATKESKGEQKTAEKETTGEKQTKDQSNDEEYWKGRAAVAQDQVTAAEAKVQKIQDDMSSMNKAYYIDGSADGVSQHAVLADELNKRQEALDAAKKELEDAKAKREGLEDEARQAGAPPGWVEQ
jgi:hypothetical protein